MSIRGKEENLLVLSRPLLGRLWYDVLLQSQARLILGKKGKSSPKKCRENSSFGEIQQNNVVQDSLGVGETKVDNMKKKMSKFFSQSRGSYRTLDKMQPSEGDRIGWKRAGRGGVGKRWDWDGWIWPGSGIWQQWHMPKLTPFPLLCA